MDCRHLKDGICQKLSDGTVRQACIESPCSEENSVFVIDSEEKEVLNALIESLYYAFGEQENKLLLLSTDKLKRAYSIAKQLFEYDLVDKDEVEEFVNNVEVEL